MARDPIKAICHRDYYPAFRTSGARPVSAIKWIVLHSTEGGTAKSIAHYFEGPFEGDKGGSTHLVLDDNECQRCLLDVAIPWGARGANTRGFHIEQCGYARWPKEEWLKHGPMLERAAYKTALHCFKFAIPPIFVTAPGLLAGREGVTTHAECSKAFGGDHWDPGSGWPRAIFMRKVRAYHADLVELMPE